MDTSRTRLTLKERRILQQTLIGWRAKNVSWLMDNYGDIEHVLIVLSNMSERGQIVKFYKDGAFQGILAFDIGHTWWTPLLICAELFVLAAEGTCGLQHAAAAELERLAAEHGAALIVSGNIFQTNSNLIGNGYKKHGFRQACSTYVKEAVK